MSASRPGLDLRCETRVRGRYMLSLSGELDVASAGLLETSIAELCTDGAEEVLLDMDGLSFMDSTGLRSLLVSQEVCMVNDCRLVLGPLSTPVERLLELAGVDEKLPREAQAKKDG